MPLLDTGVHVVTRSSISRDVTSKEGSVAGDSSINYDDLELETAGYKRQMPRQFSTLSLMSLSFCLTCTWSGTGSSMGISLTEASAAGTIWSLVPAGVMTAVVSAGMAELASAYPQVRIYVNSYGEGSYLNMLLQAGAQYTWSFMVSSDKHRAFGAYL